jgi:hypothetical protein
MKTLLLLKRRGISCSSAQNGAETSIEGEAHPHPLETLEVDHILRADMTSVLCEAINLKSNRNKYIISNAFGSRREMKRCRIRDLI